MIVVSGLCGTCCWCCQNYQNATDLGKSGLLYSLLVIREKLNFKTQNILVSGLFLALCPHHVAEI